MGDPFWLILVPFWGPFWLILVSFWVTWGPFGPLGTPWEPPGRRDLIWDPLLDHFGVTFGTPWGPLGRPLGTPRGQEGAKRLSKRGLERGPKPDPKNVPFWDPPWRCSGELSPGREHSFQEFRGVAFGTHFGIILGAFWTPGAPLFSPKGARRGKKGVRKGSEFGIVF